MTIRTTTIRLIRGAGLMRAVNGAARGWYWLVKKSSALRRTTPIDAVYTSRYFQAETDMTAPTAADVVDCLMTEFAPRSVADIGCGTGVYLREFARRGVRAWGVEGSSHAVAAAVVPRDTLLQADLSRPLQAPARHDLVISFEVGEHLPQTASGTFVRNVAAFGDDIAFSAAQPGQGGVDHINERPPEYWISEFEAIGFRHDAASTARLREAFRQRHCVWWLQHNVLSFRRGTVESPEANRRASAPAQPDHMQLKGTS